MYLYGHPRATWVFFKLQGLQYCFPEILRWTNWILILSVYCGGINKDIGKGLSQLYYIKMKICHDRCLIDIGAVITFFTCLCISRYQEYFFSQKWLKKACASLSCLDYSKVWTNFMRVKNIMSSLRCQGNSHVKNIDHNKFSSSYSTASCGIFFFRYLC